jgi:phosphate:Na+ symporter
MKMLFTVAGGLGLFLYGMQLMGDGLQKVAGDRLRRLIEMFTTVPIVGVFVGAVVTVLVQSSSATTVMIVGFVNAGLMNLGQAVSVILGANIGTTITAQMVSLKLTDLALPSIAVGFLLTMVAKSRFQRQLGQVIVGFGILFLGMTVMSDGLRPLRTNPLFTHYMILFGAQPLLGILAGAVFTAAIQSSSAFTGLIISLALQDLIGLSAAVTLILGSNIGTCITAMLASIGANITARRAALAHVLFNVGGVALFLPFVGPYTNLIAASADTVAHQAANAHTIFNVVNTLLVLPVIKHFTRLVMFLMPGTEGIVEFGPKYLDTHLIGTPSVALGQVTRELLRMGDTALAMLDDVFTSFRTGSPDELKYAAQKEEAINSLETEVVSYLVKVAQKSLSLEQSNRHSALLNITNDIERIGDHAENIIELVEYKAEHRLSFSEEAQQEIEDMYNRVRYLVSMSLQALRDDDVELAKEMLQKENEIDILERELRRSHMSRLNEGRCQPSAGIVFLDTISNLERIADHANNIAEFVISA